MKNLLDLTKAMSDKTRVRALMALSSRELCLCQLIELLELAPSTVSRHMTLLRQAGLVERRKEGTWHFYRLADGDDRPLVPQAMAWLTEALADDPQTLEDAARLTDLCKSDLEEISACYRG